MNKEQTEKWIEALKNYNGYGYFLGSINNITSYFFYHREKNIFNVIFISNNLSVKDVKFQLERAGKVFTIEKNSEQDGIFDKYNSYFENNNNYQFDYKEGLYKLNENQIKIIFSWIKALEHTNYLNIIDKSELESSKTFVYQLQDKKENIRKIKI